MSGTRQRITVGLLTTFFSLILIISSHNPLMHALFFVVILGLIWGCWQEFENICKLKNFKIEKTTALVLSAFYMGGLALYPSVEKAAFVPLVFLFTSLFFLFLKQFKQGSSPISTIACTLLGLLYITFPIATLYQIDFLLPESGMWWLLYLVIVVKLSDTVAFFVGSRVGKNKLAPYISPKKTVEGAIGGLFGSVIGSLSFHIFSPLPIGFWESIILGLVLGLLAALGDLSESLLKREVAIKDSSHLPGLGGLLDIFDSLLFPTPFLLFYLLL